MYNKGNGASDSIKGILIGICGTDYNPKIGGFLI